MKKTALTFAMLVGLATASLPAQAESFRFGIYGPNGGFTISTSDHHYVGQPVKHVTKKKRVNKKKYRQVKVLSPNRITRILRRKGFNDIHNLRTNDRYYKARAYNRRGRLVKLKIDAYNGKIVKRKPIRQWRPARYDQYRWQSTQYRAPFWMR